MTLLWWHWAVIGLGFVLAELMLPIFMLIWFGLGAFLVVLFVLAMPESLLEHQILLWVASSLLMVALWTKVFKQSRHKSLIGRASAQVVGEVGMVTEAVAPYRNGKVRFQKPMLGSEQWECVAEEAIEVGARVKVVRIEGSMVTVQRV